MRYGTIGSCQSAAITSKIGKALLVGAPAFTFTLNEEEEADLLSTIIFATF